MILAILQAATLVVAPNSPVSTIDQALRSAPAGATIIVKSGVYHEHSLRVERPLTLIGEGRPRVDGDGLGSIFILAAPNILIRGFELTNTGRNAVDDRAGIKAEAADSCVIEDNRVVGTFFGIYLARSTGCRVTGNFVAGTNLSEALSGNAIHLWNSREAIITNNEVSNHRDGIYLEFAKGVRISDNSSHGNLRYGLHFMFSDSAQYHNNRFSNNGAGVAVMYTSHVSMTENSFVNNRGPAAFGLLLKDIRDSQIERNRFIDNSVGLYLEGSNRVSVRNNQLEKNGWAVKLMANSESNEFSGNTFLTNSFDVSTNGRQHTSRFDGNYWDQYRGYDLNADGIGDVPHRPVRLFAYLVAKQDAILVLQRSIFVDLLDAAERALPILSPDALVDQRPRLLVRQ